MKIVENSKFRYCQSFNGVIMPIFKPVHTEKSMAQEAKTQGKTDEKHQKLSVFDVKALYDLAHTQQSGGCSDDEFKAILAEAVKLDMEYRRQLLEQATYKDNKQQRAFQKVAIRNQAVSA